MSKQLTQEQQKAVTDYGLAEGMTVYTVLRHVSKSGMSRSISMFIIKDGELHRLDYMAVKHFGLGKFDQKNGGIKVSGCGMDMGFHLVYNLSYAVFGSEDRGGYKLKQQWL